MTPEGKLEKLLRAMAKKRRAQGGDAFELHPATRRLLQGEVARRVPKQTSRNSLLRLFSLLRARVALIAIVFVLILIFAAMLTPGLSKSKSKAQYAGSMHNLTQVGAAVRKFADENGNRLPESLADVQRIAGTNAIIDPASGKPFVYVAGGRDVSSLPKDSVLAYSPSEEKSRAVLFADGRVEAIAADRLGELTNREMMELALAAAPHQRTPSTIPAPTAAPPVAAAAAPSAAESFRRELDKAPTVAANPPVAESAPKSKAESSDRLAKSASEPPGFGATTKIAGGATQAPATAAQSAAVDSSRGIAPTRATAPAKQSVSGNIAGNRSGELMTQSFQNVVNIGGTSKLAATAKNAYAQNVFRNDATGRNAAVLGNFQLQQNGNALNIVDDDGSVYSGYLQPADTIAASESKADQKKVTAPPKVAEIKAIPMSKAQSQAAQNFAFRVSGTNLSLNQNVVFYGSLTQDANLPQQNARAGGGGGGGPQSQAQQSLKKFVSQSLLSNARIAGTAVVNNTNAFQIDAVPVTQ